MSLLGMKSTSGVGMLQGTGRIPYSTRQFSQILNCIFLYSYRLPGDNHIKITQLTTGKILMDLTFFSLTFLGMRTNENRYWILIQNT